MKNKLLIILGIIAICLVVFLVILPKTNNQVNSNIPTEERIQFNLIINKAPDVEVVVTKNTTPINIEYNSDQIGDYSISTNALTLNDVINITVTEEVGCNIVFTLNNQVQTALEKELTVTDDVIIDILKTVEVYHGTINADVNSNIYAYELGANNQITGERIDFANTGFYYGAKINLHFDVYNILDDYLIESATINGINAITQLTNPATSGTHETYAESTFGGIYTVTGDFEVIVTTKVKTYTYSINSTNCTAMSYKVIGWDDVTRTYTSLEQTNTFARSDRILIRTELNSVSDILTYNYGENSETSYSEYDSSGVYEFYIGGLCSDAQINFIAISSTYNFIVNAPEHCNVKLQHPNNPDKDIYPGINAINKIIASGDYTYKLILTTESGYHFNLEGYGFCDIIQNPNLGYTCNQQSDGSNDFYLDYADFVVTVTAEVEPNSAVIYYKAIDAGFSYFVNGSEVLLHGNEGNTPTVLHGDTIKIVLTTQANFTYTIIFNGQELTNNTEYTLDFCRTATENFTRYLTLYITGTYHEPEPLPDTGIYNIYCQGCSTTLPAESLTIPVTFTITKAEININIENGVLSEGILSEGDQITVSWVLTDDNFVYASAIIYIDGVQSSLTNGGTYTITGNVQIYIYYDFR